MSPSFAGPLLAALATCGLLAAGCASRAPHAATAATTTSAQVASKPQPRALPQPVLMAAVRAEDDDVDDEPRGTLIIGDDVVTTCHRLRATKAPKGEENMTWLYLLKSIASCAKDGELGARPLVLRGPARPQVIVKYIFTKLGVPDERIVITDIPGERVCADDCDAADLRVNIELGSSSAGTTL